MSIRTTGKEFGVMADIERYLTENQTRQQHNRRRNGQYDAGPTCEACGKPAGHSYFSDERCNEDGIGLVLCGRKRCDTEGYVKRARGE